MKVEGIDYSIDGIEQVRTELAEIRNLAYHEWPGKIHDTLVLTAAIALLAHLVEMVQKHGDE